MNFTNLAFNQMNRMNEVYRYSSVYQEDKESLAEHISEVSMMSYLISKEFEKFNETIDKGVLLEKCLLHDIDEVLTGDVPRNTKYATSAVHRELNTVADDAVKLIESTYGSINIFDIWSNAKEGKEGLILKIVDMLCVAKKCITEIELRGNKSFLKVITELESHLDKMIKDDTKFSILDKDESKHLLKSLIIESKDEITTIRVRYQHLIDKYHIKENVIKEE